MSIPSIRDLASYQPRWPAVIELNLEDQWRARWVEEETLPPGAPVLFAYGVVFHNERGYAVRRAGSDEPWGTLEVSVPFGSDPAQAVSEAARRQLGALPRLTSLVGFLECKATSQNPDFPAGTITVRPVYLVVARALEDLPDDAGWERRRFPLAEFMKVLRRRYPELATYLGEAGQKYLVLRSRGEA